MPQLNQTRQMHQHLKLSVCLQISINLFINVRGNLLIRRTIIITNFNITLFLSCCFWRFEAQWNPLSKTMKEYFYDILECDRFYNVMPWIISQSQILAEILEIFENWSGSKNAGNSVNLKDIEVFFFCNHLLFNSRLRL